MSNKITIDDCKIIELPKIEDPRGNLTFVEGDNHLPFDIKRVYWIYDVPGGEIRGGHAYHELYEVIIALSGSFDVILDDGINKKKFSLNRSYYGLYVPKMIWRSLENFSTNSLSFIFASKKYDKKDYLRNYEEFSRIKKSEE